MDAERPSVVSILRIYTVPIIFGGISFFLIVCSLVLLVKSSFPTDEITFLDRHNNILKDVSNLASGSAITSKIMVDIEGAVVNPGVLTVQTGSRVEDVITMAGGLRKDADSMYVSQSINRAMKVVDGMKIYIPTVSETSHINNIAGQNGMMTSHNSSILLQRPDGQSQNIGGVTHVSINMASKDQLETLTGVGPVTAQKIIDNRPYQTLEELVSKKAVGQSVFEKIKEQIDL